MNLTDFPQEVVRCRGVTLRKTAEGEITQDTEQGGESCQRDSTVTATVTALNGYSYGYRVKQLHLRSRDVFMYELLGSFLIKTAQKTAQKDVTKGM